MAALPCCVYFTPLNQKSKCVDSEGGLGQNKVENRILQVILRYLSDLLFSPSPTTEEEDRRAGKSGFSWAMDGLCSDYEIGCIKRCHGFHGVGRLELANYFRSD